MYNLSELYYPITANPAGGGEYLPCKPLLPYIRCFWESAAEPREHQLETIIPDSCMDIIWEWDGETGESSGIFCGINDTPFEAGQAVQPVPRQRFAIRFHFWAVHLFADEPMTDVLNVHVPVEHYFRTFRQELGERLQYALTMAERIAAAEAFLLRRLERAGRSSDGMMNAVYKLLQSKGRVSSGMLEASSGVSSRQLERLFRRHIGLPPKKVADLIRFQNVWLDLYRSPQRPGVMQDIVYTYGYSHQSHLINNFKKFAGRTPLEALVKARS